MSRNHESTAVIKKRFQDAAERFRPSKGNDKELLDKCEKHLDAVLTKRSLIAEIKEKFFFNSEYILDGRFEDIVNFERKASKFFIKFVGDSFLVEEVRDLRSLMEEVFLGTPYEVRFIEVCNTIKMLECFV